MKNHQRFAQILIALFLIPGMLLPGIQSDQTGETTLRISAPLAEVLAEAPDEVVRIIVYRANSSGEAEQFIEEAGGEVIKELGLINAFAARVQARYVPDLAQLSAVSLVALDAPVRSSSLITETVRDNFDTRSYSNNDGSMPWAGPWTEINDDNEADGGKIKSTNRN